jgi:hypothetical protein
MGGIEMEERVEVIQVIAHGRDRDGGESGGDSGDCSIV